MIITEWGYVFEHEGLPGTSQAVFLAKKSMKMDVNRSESIYTFISKFTSHLGDKGWQIGVLWENSWLCQAAPI